MSDIDWSKAPEGAQAYMPANDQWFEGWWKMVGAQSYFWAAKGCENSRWEASNARPWDFRLLVKRPAEPAWTGTGLPPVGTVCEYLCGSGSWVEVEITAIARLGVCFVQQGRGGENYVALTAQFRPCRTPEQIAAEERSAFIAEIASLLGWDSSMHGSQRDAGKLYDAGYRKLKDL